MGTATTGQITRMFFRELRQGSRIAQRRLALLHKEKLLKRTKANINAEYCYYNKGSQQQHQILITEFYVRLFELGGTIQEFAIQKKIENVIPDAYVEYDYRGYRHFMFVEAERSNNRFNQKKYEELLAKMVMPIFPKVIILSDRKINISETKIKHYMLNSNMDGFINIFSQYLAN